jgi:hypothetical protein
MERNSLPHLTTIISFSSIESFFLPRCIAEAKKFSNKVIVVLCDHLFDKTAENINDLEKLFSQCPEAEFIIYPYSKDPSLLKKIKAPHARHNISRIIGVRLAKQKNGFFLFLDGDEIMDGDAFKNWYEKEDFSKYDAFKFSCYWYFRDVCYQATTYETAALMIRPSLLHSRALWDKHERGGIFTKIKKRKKDHVKDQNDLPFCHHYSWVRSKENLLKKIKAWGHRGERDWEKMIDESFQSSFKGRDFVHGYTYKKITCPFSFASQWKTIPKITFLSKKEFFQILFGKFGYIREKLLAKALIK